MATGDGSIIDLGVTVVSWADATTAASVRLPHRQCILLVGPDGLYLVDRPLKQRIMSPLAAAVAVAGIAGGLLGGSQMYAAGALGVVAAFIMFYLGVQRAPVSSEQLRLLERERDAVTPVPFEAILSVGPLSGASRRLRWTEIVVGERILRLHHSASDYHRLREAVGPGRATLFRALAEPL